MARARVWGSMLTSSEADGGGGRRTSLPPMGPLALALPLTLPPITGDDAAAGGEWRWRRAASVGGMGQGGGGKANVGDGRPDALRLLLAGVPVPVYTKDGCVGGKGVESPASQRGQTNQHTPFRPLPLSLTEATRDRDAAAARGVGGRRGRGGDREGEALRLELRMV